jgi:hypothetical protein
MLGIAREDWADYTRWRQLVHPEDWDRAVAFYANTREGDAREPIEYRLIARDGRIVWIRVIASVRRDRAGRAIALDCLAFDISEVVRARETLARSEYLFRLLVNEASNVIAISNADGTARWVSPSIEQITGRPADAYIGKDGFAFIHPEDADRARHLFTKSFVSPDKTSGTMIVRASAADGGWRHLEVWGTNMLDEPAVRGIVVSARDVTDELRVRDELAMRGREQAAVADLGLLALRGEPLGSLMQKSAEAVYEALSAHCAGVWELDPRGGVMTLRLGAGCGDEPAIHPTVPCDKSSLCGYVLISDDAIVSAEASAETRFSLPQVLVDRGVVSSAAVTIRGPAIPYGILTVHDSSVRAFSEQDISFLRAVANILGIAIERTRMVDELAETKDFLEHLVRSSPVGIVTGIANGMVIDYVSPNVERLLGAAPPDPPRTTEWFMERTHPEERELLGSLLERANQAREPTVKLTTRLRHESGDYRFFEVVMHFSYGAQKHPATFLGYFVDITEMVQAERDRQLLEDELHDSRRLEAVGALAGGVAHDFNNRLAVMLTFTELALHDLESANPVREHILEIKIAAERAALLTRQLLVFARRQLVSPRPLDVGDVIASMQTMLGRTLGEHIELEVEAAPGLWPAIADPSQIEQIVLDLSINARDAMPTSGRLTIDSSNVVLDEDYVSRHPEASAGPHVRVRFADTGTGMTSEIAARAVEPFFTTKPVGYGTGLGLAAVYGIVKQAGGHLMLLTAPDMGTTVELFFPATRARDWGRTDAGPVAVVAGRGETILVTEDEEQVRKAVCAALAGNGYEVLQASRGEEALAIGRDHPGPIDLLLTDVVMPVMSGRALAEKFRTVRPKIGVLLMSGYPDQAGASEWSNERLIEKPFSMQVLLHRVREALSASGATGPSP